VRRRFHSAWMNPTCVERARIDVSIDKWSPLDFIIDSMRLS
jgi:hypothetical protein